MIIQMPKVQELSKMLADKLSHKARFQGLGFKVARHSRGKWTGMLFETSD